MVVAVVVFLVAFQIKSQFCLYHKQSISPQFRIVGFKRILEAKTNHNGNSTENVAKQKGLKVYGTILM